MRTKIVVIFCMICFRSKAQYFMEYDTIRKNEFSVSFLPILVAFSGYDPYGRWGSHNFSYKRFFKNKIVFRSALVIAPEWDMGNPYYVEQYDTTYGGLNYFTTSSRRAGRGIL